MRWIACCLLLALSACQAPESVREAEITQALIFDAISDSFRDWVEAVDAPTPAAAEAKAQVLEQLALKRAEYRSTHELLRQYLETGDLAELLRVVRPEVEHYLEWLKTPPSGD